MSVKTKNFIVSFLISFIYYFGISRFPTLANKYIKSEFVIKNLTNINIIERIREIATIKVLGFRHREVSAYMYRENFILTAIGIAIGLPLGKLLLGFIIKQINVDIIFFVAKLLPSDYIFAGLITVLFTIVVSIVMYRKLIGVDMVESLKSAE